MPVFWSSFAMLERYIRVEGYWAPDRLTGPATSAGGVAVAMCRQRAGTEKG